MKHFFEYKTELVRLISVLVIQNASTGTVNVSYNVIFVKSSVITLIQQLLSNFQLAHFLHQIKKIRINFIATRSMLKTWPGPVHMPTSSTTFLIRIRRPSWIIFLLFHVIGFWFLGRPERSSWSSFSRPFWNPRKIKILPTFLQHFS